jgi:hypothetical protein
MMRSDEQNSRVVQAELGDLEAQDVTCASFCRENHDLFQGA